jgi:hypothetical protein
MIIRYWMLDAKFCAVLRPPWLSTYKLAPPFFYTFPDEMTLSASRPPLPRAHGHRHPHATYARRISTPPSIIHTDISWHTPKPWLAHSSSLCHRLSHSVCILRRLHVRVQPGSANSHSPTPVVLRIYAVKPSGQTPTILHLAL